MHAARFAIPLVIAFLALGGGAAQRSEAAPGGLVAAYSFDAGSGTTLRDESGSGNTGAIFGASWSTAGRHGGALSFDGADDLVTVADSASLDLTGAMTLEAWVRPTAALEKSWRTVAFKEQPGQLSYALYANDGSRAPSGHVFTSQQRAAAGRAQIPAGAWTHVATTYDGNALRLYVNGALSSEASVSGQVRASTGPLRIGGNQIWGEYFAGLIDDVRLYNRALNGAQIQTDRAAPVGRVAAAPPKPAAGRRSDAQAPTKPSALRVTRRTATTITVLIGPSRDNVAVAGYERYVGRKLVGRGAGRTFTFSRLACGKRYGLAVAAYDRAGNRSARKQITAPTRACPARDRQAPTKPAGLTVGSVSDTSISVRWSASKDNLRVSGYRAYRNGAAVGSTGATSFSFTGLACNTGYTLAVEAFDPGGNRSAKTELKASTSACPLPGIADAFVAPTGSDGGSCTRAAPCRSLNRAYRVVSPGGVVEVAGGSYPDQDVTHDPSKPLASTRVLFRPAAGATVAMNSLENWASNVHFKDFRLPTGAPAGGDTGVAELRGGRNVTIENFTASKPYVWNTPRPVGIENLLILGGNFGPHPSCGGGAQITDMPKNVTIDGATFHDFTVPSSCSSAHLDCVHTFGSDGLTIRNSRFVRCEHFGILINGGRDITIENNFLTGGIYGFKLRGDNSPSVEVFNNVLIRFNSGDEIDLGSSGSNTLNNVRVENNATADGIPCRSGVTYVGNLSQQRGVCGGTDRRVARIGFANPGAADFHLVAGSPAIDAATGTSFPARDIDGEARPAGARADVGADERR